MASAMPTPPRIDLMPTSPLAASSAGRSCRHRLQSRRAEGVGSRAQLLRLPLQLLRLLKAALGNIAVDFLEERPVAARLEKLIDCRNRGAAHRVGSVR